MDLAVTLVKSVMRAFYQTREILVIDALILHETYVRHRGASMEDSSLTSATDSETTISHI